MITTEFFWQAQQVVHCSGFPSASLPVLAQLAPAVPADVSRKPGLTQELE
jgi:hypothetical protein